MTSESARPKLVGLTVSDAAPILHQHVRLRPGLTVVFGKNGVGKTRLLRSIGDMLRLANTSTTQVFMDLAGNEAEVPLTRSQAPTLDQVMYGYSAFHFQAGGTDDAGDWTPFEGESSDIWTHEAQVRYIADSLPPSVGEEAAEYLLVP